VAETFWSQAGQYAVLAILFVIALRLYWAAVVWCGQRLYEADQEAQRRQRMGTLLAIADYLESKNTARHHTQEFEGTAFALDEPDEAA
jgi:hypothetical protein